MGYQYTQFGSTLIPQLDAEQDIGSGIAPAYLIPMDLGGGYDPKGTQRVYRPPRAIAASGWIVAATPSALKTAYAAWLALVGTRASLFRLGDGDGSSQWATARLQEVRCKRTPIYSLAVQVELTFVLVSPCFYGTTPYNAQYTLDTNPRTCVVANAGDHPVLNAILSLMAGSSPITRVKIGVSGVTEIQWDGSLASGKILTINCGARSVVNDTTSEYKLLTRTANHKVAEWLRLNAGNTSVVVTLTGGSTNSVINFAYYDGWA